MHKLRNCIPGVLSLIVLSLLFFYMAHVAWGRLADILMDFGRELYTPWQLSEGKVLGVDIATLFGPLSQYVNAFLFKIFGVSFLTITIANHVIAAFILLLVYLLAYRCSDHFTAAVASIFFLCVFCFARYGVFGSFNFISPYSHESTHGTLLCLAMVLVYSSFASRRHRLASFFGGLLLGAALLTKTDIVVAALMCAGAAHVGMIYFDVVSKRPVAKRFFLSIFLSACGVSILPLTFILFYLNHMPFPLALDNTFAALTRVSGADVDLSSMYFYQKSLGFDKFTENLLLLFHISAWLIAALLLLIAVEVALAKAKIEKRLYVLLSVLGFCVSAWTAKYSIPFQFWMDTPRAFPLIVFLSLSVSVVLLWRERGNLEGRGRLFSFFMLHVLALAMLAKIVLRTRFFDYGFYLALPASVCVTILFLYVIPNLCKRYCRCNHVFFRYALLGLFLVPLIMHAQYSRQQVLAQRIPVGNGLDVIMAVAHKIKNTTVGVRGYMMKETVEAVERIIPPHATMVVIPEGVMLNYLTRRVNPTPYLNFMLVELLVFGEKRIIESLDQAAPDYVVIVHKKTEEYGYEMFGTDPAFGKKMLEWVDLNYRPVHLVGYPPLRKKLEFGIMIMKRRVAESRLDL